MQAENGKTHFFNGTIHTFSLLGWGLSPGPPEVFAEPCSALYLSLERQDSNLFVPQPSPPTSAGYPCLAPGHRGLPLQLCLRDQEASPTLPPDFCVQFTTWA